MPRIIAPSVLSADFSNLAQDIQMINDSKAEWIHYDVMDGVFVPNISFGFPILKAINKITHKFIDVHLMIVNPEKYINDFKEAGADGISIHWEGNIHVLSILNQIRDAGLEAGLALNPATPIHVITDIVDSIDMLLIMSVNPGFGGQKFIEKTYNRVAEAKALIQSKNANTIIQVDGGVGPNNAKKVFAAGADVLVSGSAVFKAANPSEAILEMLK
tara:strand:+ start:1797 stop:2444 length:648 start_codon:yes stop_codon:yes gene_type:complete